MGRIVYRTKTFIISSITAISFAFALMIPIVTIYLINHSKKDQTEFLNTYKIPDSKKQNIIKSRSLSMFFAKPRGSFDYLGTYGTGWIVPQGVIIDEKKGIDNIDSLTCYVATNVHVVEKFVNIHIDKDPYAYSWNQNFSYLFLSFFNQANFKELVGTNLASGQFLEKDNVSVSKMFLEINKNQKKYPVAKFQDLQQNPYKETDPFYLDGQTNKVYIKNSYSELTLLKMDVSKTNPRTKYFFEFCKNVYKIDHNQSEKNPYAIDFIKRDEFEEIYQVLLAYQTSNNQQVNKSQIKFYVGGFPFVPQNETISWKNFEIPLSSNNRIVNISFSSSRSTESNQIFSDPNKGLKLNVEANNNIEELYFKNTALQFIIEDINLGQGSSGSMLVCELPPNHLYNYSRYRIIGIWWGVYETLNVKKSYKGGVDSLIATRQYLSSDTHKWEPYNNIQVIEKFIRDNKVNINEKK